MDNVQIFIEHLLKEKNLPGLDQEVHDQLVTDLSIRLTKYINKRVLESMPEGAMIGLEQLLGSEQPDENQIQEYINKNSEDLMGITSTAMAEFRQLYLGE
jgi:uncharacterized protein YbcC (UPF0753/DUF2309 family)